MATRKGHINFKAFSLLALLAMALSLQFLHTIAEHGHDHSDAPSCHAYEGKGKHLHDERYGHHDCQLCAFCLKVCGIPSSPEFLTPLGGFADRLQFLPEQSCVKTACDTTYRRGPPVL
jgi:hypothetical protein